MMLFLAAMVFGMTGCGGGGDSVSTPITTNSVGTVKGVYKKISAPSLFLSEGSFSAGSSLVKASTTFSNDKLKVVTEINGSNTPSPVIFTTSTNQNVVMNTTLLKRITPNVIAISFNILYVVDITDPANPLAKSEISQSGNALLNVSTGTYYNLTGYDVSSSLIEGNNLYILKDLTLYKIDLANIGVAVPLNNPNFNPATKPSYILGNKVITGKVAFDKNAIIPPKSIVPVDINEGTMTGVGQALNSGVSVNDWNTGEVIDVNNELWAYRVDNSGTNSKIGKYKLTINDNGQVAYSDYSEISLTFKLSGDPLTFPLSPSGKYGDHIMISGTGFVTVKKAVGGGITITSSTLDFTGTDSPNYYNCPAYYGNILYWNTSLGTILGMNTLTNTLSTIYSSANLVTSNYGVTGPPQLLLSNGKLLFYQYLGASEVGTYALAIGATVPVQMSTSKMNVESIIELLL